MAEKSSFIDALAGAVTDIREKLVEEPWFGKVVTEQQEEKGVTEQRGEVPGWGSKIRQAEIAPQEPEREREPDRDMER